MVDRGGRRGTLATRPYPTDEISLMGSDLLRFRDEIPQIGDDVGVAATGPRVAAAFVLPDGVEAQLWAGHREPVTPGTAPDLGLPHY